MEQKKSKDYFTEGELMPVPLLNAMKRLGALQEGDTLVYGDVTDIADLLDAYDEMRQAAGDDQ